MTKDGGEKRSELKRSKHNGCQKKIRDAGKDLWMQAKENDADNIEKIS